MLTFALLLLTADASSEHVLPITNASGNTRATAVLMDKFTLLTAAHAVGEVRTNVFLMCGNEEVAGVVTRKAKVHDLATIQLYRPCKAVVPAEFATEDPSQGDDITFVGYPAGQFEAGVGKVRGYGFFTVRQGRLGAGLMWMAMILDADVRPGNSGGAVFTKFGKLVGIVHGFHESAPGKPGIAVPLSAIIQFLTTPEE